MTIKPIDFGSTILTKKVRKKPSLSNSSAPTFHSNSWLINLKLPHGEGGHMRTLYVCNFSVN